MKDGTIIPKDETLTDEQKANCIGIVFYPDSKLRFHSYEKHAILHENGQPGVHGYVVALTDANVDYDNNNNLSYTVNYENPYMDHENIPNSTTREACDANNGGLYYTVSMSQDAYNEGQLTGAVKRYNQQVPTPNTATQWFAPSVGQWMDMLRKISTDENKNNIVEGLTNFNSGYDPNNRIIFYMTCGDIITKLNNKMSHLTVNNSNLYDPFVKGNEYWTSLEYDQHWAWSVRLSYQDNSSGKVVDQNGVTLVVDGKWQTKRLRCMLAF
jgi:hypothetical protein